MIKNVSAFYIFKEKVYSQIILKNIIHCQNEWILRLEQNIFFSFCIYYLAFFDQNVFINSLHSMLFSCFDIYYEKYFSKRAFVDNFFYFEIVQIYCILSFLDFDFASFFILNFFNTYIF